MRRAPAVERALETLATLDDGAMPRGHDGARARADHSSIRADLLVPSARAGEGALIRCTFGRKDWLGDMAEHEAQYTDGELHAALRRSCRPRAW